MTTEQQPTLADLFPIPDEARRLERFVGSWRLEGTMTAEGAVMPMAGEWHFTPAAAGWGVASTLRAVIEGLGPYEEHDLCGYDVETGMFHLYSLTNSGAVHDHIARWRTSDVLEFEYTGLQGGKPYRETGLVEFLSDGTVRVHSEDIVDGELVSAMDGTLTRAS